MDSIVAKKYVLVVRRELRALGPEKKG